MNILAAIKAIAEMPAALHALAMELRGLGEKLNDVQAEERAEDKHKRNRAAVRAILERRVSGGEDGQRPEAHRPR